MLYSTGGGGGGGAGFPAWTAVDAVAATTRNAKLATSNLDLSNAFIPLLLDSWSAL
jgi:hypothetical protein